jgi:hypothetical protein
MPQLGSARLRHPSNRHAANESAHMLKRLKEPSTWAGLAILVLMWHIHARDPLGDSWLYIVIVFGAVMAMVFTEG